LPNAEGVSHKMQLDVDENSVPMTMTPVSVTSRYDTYDICRSAGELDSCSDWLNCGSYAVVGDVYHHVIITIIIIIC